MSYGGSDVCSSDLISLDRDWPALRGDDGRWRWALRLSFPLVPFSLCRRAVGRRCARSKRDLLRSGSVRAGCRRNGADPDCARPPINTRAPRDARAWPFKDRHRQRRELMEIVLALGIGIFTASGVWLLFRPRTFQVIIGLSLLSYAVNLFILAMGRLRMDAPPIVERGATVDPSSYADPLPQALVLTAIVISFATTALLLVVLLASRGQPRSEHVDRSEETTSELSSL